MPLSQSATPIEKNLEIGPGAGPQVPWALGQRESLSILIHIRPKAVSLFLAGLLGLLLIPHFFGIYSTFVLGHAYAWGLVPLFNLGMEANIPAFFSTFLFLSASLLFAIIALQGNWNRREKGTWLLLAFTLFFVGVDEFAQIHEKLIEPVRSAFSLSGYLYFAWVIPYSFAVIALGMLSWKLIWRLGWQFRLLFAAAAFTFLAGAVGFEMIGAKEFDAMAEAPTLRYRLIQTLEEVFEFIGQIILVYTLLELLRKNIEKLDIRINFKG